MASAVQEKLKVGILDLQAALADVAQARQSIVGTSLILRRVGEVYAPRMVQQFERARRSVVKTAYQLDDVLDVIQREDNGAWLKMIASFNDYARYIPGVNISSISVGEIVELAIPPIPQAILVPADSVEARKELKREIAFYGMKPDSSLNGLGFFPALGPLFAACGPAIAATAAATAGVGGVVVAVGCGLGALAIIAGTVYLASKAVQLVSGVVDAFVPNAAASREEAKRLSVLKDVYSELNAASVGMTPSERAKLFDEANKNGVKPPEGGESATMMIALGVAALAIVAIYVLPRFKSSQSVPAMAGAPRRRRSMRSR